MAKIIKHGKISVKVANDECYNCKSLIQYEKSDIKSNSRVGSYVMCPVCSAHINASTLKWIELFHD